MGLSAHKRPCSSQRLRHRPQAFFADRLGRERRAHADGNATGDPVVTSGQGTTDFEQATVVDPVGSYVVRVINWAAAEAWSGTVTYAGPDPYQAPEETWTLSCETPEGVTRSARQVFVARGERRSLDLRCDVVRRRSLLRARAAGLLLESLGFATERTKALPPTGGG